MGPSAANALPAPVAPPTPLSLFTPCIPARPAHLTPIAIRGHTVVTALGDGRAALSNAVQSQRSGLQPLAQASISAAVGRIDRLDVEALPGHLTGWDCRATRLAWRGLHSDEFAASVAAAMQRHGSTRVGLVMGTSASTVAVSELAYRHPAANGGFPQALRVAALHSMHAVALFCARVLQVDGPAVTISTACSSSARAFGHAERWLRLKLVDAVVVGGVDALCDSVLYGFHALGLMAPDTCRPFDRQRCGISVGEAAGFALLERIEDAHHSDPLLLGYGESNDAHHMSSPQPEGLGAERALDDALARAGLTAADIDYLNLHGTATPQNDAVEAALVARRYSPQVHASATKGQTGHAMGAAGIVEAALCLLALHSGWRSGSSGLTQIDPAFDPRFASQLRTTPQRVATQVAASHSFGFGGNNGVLIFGGPR
ncbi:MAG: beta-ketoacyl-ACP synthase [Pseudomonadota bacterium]|nr:beta-ketoacyl-ACP synthase [Pseudomonadota bacterium]